MTSRGEKRIKNETLTVLSSYPIARGLPLPPGAVRDEKGVSVTDAEGNALPREARVLQRRPVCGVESFCSGRDDACGPIPTMRMALDETRAVEHAYRDAQDTVGP